MQYKTTHFSRTLELFCSLSFAQRLRILLGLPVNLVWAQRYTDEHETPLNSTVCDVQANLQIGG